MEDLVKGAIGSEGSYDVDFKDAKVILNVSYAGDQAQASLSLSVSIDLLMDKIKDKIPGQIDDAVIDLLKSALKAL